MKWFILVFALVISCVAQAQHSTTSNSVPRVTIKTVATLPTCNSGAEGTIYGVSDALTPAALATVSGGGAVHVAVYCNGSNWIVM